MKKIKRTIRIRKVEFISSNKHDHQLNVEVCPLCHSPISVLPPAKGSAAEISAVESPLQLQGKREIEQEDKNLTN